MYSSDQGELRIVIKQVCCTPSWIQYNAAPAAPFWGQTLLTGQRTGSNEARYLHLGSSIRLRALADGETETNQTLNFGCCTCWFNRKAV